MIRQSSGAQAIFGEPVGRLLQKLLQTWLGTVPHAAETAPRSERENEYDPVAQLVEQRTFNP
jgi:hypothetical protein